MIILLTLLSLCATDCRVHRVPMADTVGCEIAVGVVSRMPQGCLTKSHWFDTCAVKMRCDTVWYYRERLFGFRYVTDSIPDIHCYPDTAVDNGHVGTMSLQWHPMEPICKPQSLDSTELADIREMLREWRVEKCVASAYRHWGRDWIFPDEEKRIADSCECVYGGRK